MNHQKKQEQLLVMWREIQPEQHTFDFELHNTTEGDEEQKHSHGKEDEMEHAMTKPSTI